MYSILEIRPTAITNLSAKSKETALAYVFLRLAPKGGGKIAARQ